jgi:hypothetical protein
MHSVTFKMPTHFELTKAIVNTMHAMNDVEMHARWIPDEDRVRIIRNKPGFSKVTPGEVNRAISITVSSPWS